MLTEYRRHVAERAVQGLAAKPLTAEQTATVVELIQDPSMGEEKFLLDL
jgi:aconitate hydratase 2/2-methylisocitrate dehydratase